MTTRPPVGVSRQPRMHRSVVLPEPDGTLQRHDLAPRHRQRDPVQHRHLVRPLAVDLRHIAAFEHSHDPQHSVT